MKNPYGLSKNKKIQKLSPFYLKLFGLSSLTSDKLEVDFCAGICFCMNCEIINPAIKQSSSLTFTPSINKEPE